MTPYETVAHFLDSDLEHLSLVFAYLAEHSYEARLQNGEMLRDATDFRYWLRELSEAAKVVDSGQSNLLRTAQRVIDETCPRCGHVHEGSAECGFDIGGGRICHCEMEVRA